MSLIYNAVNPKAVYYNGIALTEVYYNGIKVWPSLDPIYMLDQFMRNFTKLSLKL